MWLVLFIVGVVWAAARARTPVTAFRRTILVNVPRELAWEHFSRPRQWVSWLGESGAPKDFGPGEIIGPDSSASFAGGVSFRMATFAPPDHWMWRGRVLGAIVDYDHIFEPVGERQTRMVFQQTATGFGNVIIAPLIRLTTSMIGHQAALDRLAAEINRLPAAAH